MFGTVIEETSEESKTQENFKEKRLANQQTLISQTEWKMVERAPTMGAIEMRMERDTIDGGLEYETRMDTLEDENPFDFSMIWNRGSTFHTKKLAWDMSQKNFDDQARGNKAGSSFWREKAEWMMRDNKRLKAANLQREKMIRELEGEVDS